MDKNCIKNSDLSINSTQMSVVLGCQRAVLETWIKHGHVPPPDFSGRSHRPNRWFLSSLEAWNPAVAKLAAVIASIEPVKIPLNYRCQGRRPGVRPKRCVERDRLAALAAQNPAPPAA